ncbi:MAG: hypothetical protein GX864_02550 [Mollicutes bacterium]|nr:hypothetical protein [Mollicutes bacterium]
MLRTEQNNVMFAQELEEIKRYYEVLLMNITHSAGIFNVLLSERLAGFIFDGNEIDNNIFQLLNRDLKHINQLIDVYSKMDKKGKEVMINNLSDEIHSKATSMQEYLSFIQQALKDSIFDNYVPLTFNSYYVRVGKDPVNHMKCIDRTVECFNETADQYNGKAYSYK